MCTGVRRGIRESTPEGTSLSARIRSARRMARWVARVRREGWPGPEPARIMRPFLVVVVVFWICFVGGFWLEKVVEVVGFAEGERERGGEVLVGFVEYDCRTVSTSSSDIEAKRRRGQYSQI